MAIDGVTVLAVVPARGGSKSILRKNMQEVGGRTMVAHAAAVTQALPWIDYALLSTDDDELAAEGERAGLAVPFRRPAELASDTATSLDMWRHAWTEAEKRRGMRFDISVLLEPTSPLREAEDVERCVRAMLDGGHAAAVTVSRTPAHFTPEKTLVIRDGRLDFYLDGAGRYLRQGIPAYYHRNGACYALRRETLFERGTIIEYDCAPVVIDRELVNIDDPHELALAEWLFQRAQPKAG